jgi:hypothetical protein
VSWQQQQQQQWSSNIASSSRCNHITHSILQQLSE